jgi:hypothetical protein
MSKFKILANDGGLRTIAVNLHKDDSEYQSVIQQLGSEEFDRLVLSVGEFESIEFLRPFENKVKCLVVNSSVNTSLTGIENLNHLREFNCEAICLKPYPNFAAVKSLETCILTWDKKYDAKGYLHGLFTLPVLSSLTLRYWTKPDCTEIVQLNQLRKLDLRQGSLTSLRGLEARAALTHLHLSHLKKLVDVSQVSELVNAVQLHIQNCPAISKLTDVLSGLGKLRTLHLENFGEPLKNFKWVNEQRHILLSNFSDQSLLGETIETVNRAYQEVDQRAGSMRTPFKNLCAVRPAFI